jgi:MOSC domain-containing protein YiiM
MQQSQADATTPKSADGRLVSINVGRPRTLEWQGRTITTSIWKERVSGPVMLRGVNVDGDDQSDREAHGGTYKAVYAYALEDYRSWEEEFGLAIQPGLFGENLTIEGMDVSQALIGERWQVGTAVLAVTQPRIPCYKLGIRLQDPTFPRRFAAAERPGAYLQIITEGIIAAGDDVSVLYRPAHGLTAALVSRAYHVDRSLLPKLIEVTELTPSWREWAQRMLLGARHQTET